VRYTLGYRQPYPHTAKNIHERRVRWENEKYTFEADTVEEAIRKAKDFLLEDSIERDGKTVFRRPDELAVVVDWESDSN